MFLVWLIYKIQLKNAFMYLIINVQYVDSYHRSIISDFMFKLL